MNFKWKYCKSNLKGTVKHWATSLPHKSPGLKLQFLYLPVFHFPFHRNPVVTPNPEYTGLCNQGPGA